MIKKEKLTKNIGEVLIENKIISKEVLAKALQYQAVNGGNLTQFLVHEGYIKEEDIVKCISSQFGYPYLPLAAYDVPRSVLKTVPSYLAEKYWLVPIDKIGNLLTVVMANPLDVEAVSAIEKETGCNVQPFVGMRSDIAKAIERLYNITMDDRLFKKDKKDAPLVLESLKAPGLENRRALRIRSKIGIHFTQPGAKDMAGYKDAETKDVSRYGFLFESPNILPVGSYLMMKVDLPDSISTASVNAVAQVVRVIPLENKKFDIAVKVITMPKGAADKVIKHAMDMSKKAKAK